jgi:hypothetical protein
VSEPAGADPAETERNVRVRSGHRTKASTTMTRMASPVRTSAGSVNGVVEAAMSE